MEREIKSKMLEKDELKRVVLPFVTCFGRVTKRYSISLSAVIPETDVSDPVFQKLFAIVSQCKSCM